MFNIFYFRDYIKGLYFAGAILLLVVMYFFSLRSAVDPPNKKDQESERPNPYRTTNLKDSGYQ